MLEPWLNAPGGTETKKTTQEMEINGDERLYIFKTVCTSCEHSYAMNGIMG